MLLSFFFFFIITVCVPVTIRVVFALTVWWGTPMIKPITVQTCKNLMGHVLCSETAEPSIPVHVWHTVWSWS